MFYIFLAVWKAAKPGEPAWESPYGMGRPGWHIECSAMSRTHLGKTIDLHCGGQDLIFPHHENEIAQSECANGCEFARYWMHNGFINVDNQKMSKSLHNFFTVRDVANLYGYEPIRYFMLTAGYRMPLNYTVDLIESCKNSLERLYTCRENLDFALSKSEFGADETKAAIEAKCAPDCVEMEGAAVSQIAAKNGVPCVILRAMSDNADEDGHEVLVVKKFSIAAYVATATQIVAAMVEAL